MREKQRKEKQSLKLIFLAFDDQKSHQFRSKDSTNFRTQLSDFRALSLLSENIGLTIEKAIHSIRGLCLNSKEQNSS